MASAVLNSTGDIYFSKVIDAGVTPANNVITTTAAVAPSPNTTVGAWTSDLTNATNALYSINASEAGPVKGTSNGIKITVATAFTTGNIAVGYLSATGVDLSGYDAVTFYIRADTAIAASSLQFLLCTDASGATPVETLNLPAIPKTTLTSDAASDTAADIDKWCRVVLRLSAPGGCTAIRTIVLKVAVDLSASANVLLYIHEFRGLKSFPGRTNFSISETVDTTDVSDYQSLTAKEFAPTYSTWTATIDGHKEGAPPMDKGKEYVLGIWESDTVGQCFVGNAFYTAFNPSGAFNEVVKYGYTFQGTGYLARPLS